MADNNFHRWRPSVISAKNPAQDNAYVGNVIIGVNITRTEVIQQMNALGSDIVRQVNEEGDRYIQEISDLLVKYEAVSGILDNLFEVFVEKYGEADPDAFSGRFELGNSVLDSGILG